MSLLFSKPIDEFEIKGRGIVRVVELLEPTTREALNGIAGNIVHLAGKPYRVHGVESYGIAELRQGQKVGLLGYYTGVDDMDLEFMLCSSCRREWVMDYWQKLPDGGPAEKPRFCPYCGKGPVARQSSTAMVYPPYAPADDIGGL